MAQNDGSRTIAHPQYGIWASTWTKLHDVYEGAGGFLTDDKPYLMPHPREWLDHSIASPDGAGMVPNPYPIEPSPKLTMRRKLARYENIAAAVLDTVTGALFADVPSRVVGENASGDSLIEQWWANVDGKNTKIDAALQAAWIPGAVFGHALVLMEKGETEASTAADQSLPRICTYTPLDVLDWLTDDYGKLTAVKLLEAAPRTAFARVKPSDLRVRVVDEMQWTLYDYGGRVIETAPHGFGRLPVVVVYGKRRTTIPFIGKSILGDPMLFIDAYNLVSEERELLRNQTFAILNVPIGKDGDVATEQSRLGSQSGTANVMFSGEAASFISPSGENVSAYQATSDRLARMIYRLAAVPWEGDSRDAESADSKRLKRADLTSTLTKYAGEVARVDAELTELVYRSQYGEGWEAAMKNDQVSVTYPDTFDPPDLQAVADRVAAALGLDLGETATKALKKQTARAFLPDVDPVTVKQMDADIDGQTIQTADEKRQQMLEDAAARMAQGPRMAKPVVEPEQEQP